MKKLSGRGAFLLAAGSYHSLAVTIHGQVTPFSCVVASYLVFRESEDNFYEDQD